MKKFLLQGTCCIRRLLFMALAALPASALAVPAAPYPLEMPQPDGTTVTLTLNGDENFHYYTTIYGKPVIQHQGYYYYAMQAADGSVKASDVRVSNAGSRSASETSFADGINSRAIIERMIADRPAKRFTPAVRTPMHEVTMRRASEPSTLNNPPFPLPGTFTQAHRYPTIGSPKQLVILVEYLDVPFSTPNVGDYFRTILSQPDYTENGFTGSAFDYYRDASNGQFTPDFVVLGPVTLPHAMSYYGGNVNGSDGRPYEMVTDACNILDVDVDFTQFDNNNDGIIDNVFVFYAGRGEATGGGEDTVWPHSWNVPGAPVYDGVHLDSYACSNELVVRGNSLVPDAIGTFCHEFGHVLGLPDLYNTNYSSNAQLPDSWDIMCSGSYNNNSKTPPTMSSYERGALGWLHPIPLEETGDYQLLNSLQYTNTAYLIPTYKDTEYFLLENRSQKGWDAYCPGDGMLVWHIDYDPSIFDYNIVNNDPDHPYVDIVESHGNQYGTMHMFDGFPGMGDGVFDFDSTPSLSSWSGKRLGVALSDIRYDEEGEEGDDDEPEFSGDILFHAEVTATGVGTVNKDICGDYSLEGRQLKAFVNLDVYGVDGTHAAHLNAGENMMLAPSTIYLLRTLNGAAKLIVK